MKIKDKRKEKGETQKVWERERSKKKETGQQNVGPETGLGLCHKPFGLK